MKIIRQGSWRNMGQTYIELKDTKISWSKHGDGVSLRCTNVPDFSTDARHDYDVTLTVDEVRRILDVALSAQGTPADNK